VDISVIIPVYNEVKALAALYRELTDVLGGLEKSAEIFFIDDGSRDGSSAVLDELALSDARVQVLHLRRNYGQTAAMMAGFQHCTGDVIIPMDADGQNDQADTPRLLNKVSEGFDVVSGWRINRDDRFSRRLPSMVANRLISSLLGVPLHDYGCTLKAYRREVIEDVRLMARCIASSRSMLHGRARESPSCLSPTIPGCTANRNTGSAEFRESFSIS
jgi:glycosyltransferase involved in cell wall biosynthesis